MGLTKQTKEQGQLVVKSNDLIQKNRYNLSAQQQKVLLYLISKIKPTDTELLPYNFRIKDFCETCGIDGENGKNYVALKSAIRELNACFWIEVDGEETMYNWVKEAKIRRKSGTIVLELDKKLEPYLLQLRENFTSYEIAYVLAMRGKYAIRLYEILKSCAYKGGTEESIDSLKKRLETAMYSDYKNFRVNVIDKAIAEINLCTDLIIAYKPKRTGRNITSIAFEINKKETIEDRLCAAVTIQERIGRREDNA